MVAQIEEALSIEIGDVLGLCPKQGRTETNLWTRLEDF